MNLYNSNLNGTAWFTKQFSEVAFSVYLALKVCEVALESVIHVPFYEESFEFEFKVHISSEINRTYVFRCD